MKYGEFKIALVLGSLEKLVQVDTITKDQLVEELKWCLEYLGEEV